MVSTLPSGASQWDDAQAMIAIGAPSPYAGILKALGAAYLVSRMLPTEFGKILGKLR